VKHLINFKESFVKTQSLLISLNPSFPDFPYSGTIKAGPLVSKPSTLSALPQSQKALTKGDKFKKLISNMLQENAKLVDSKDIRWEDFGGKYRGKVKRDGSQLVKMLDDDINDLSQILSSSSANSERVEEDKAMVDITSKAVI
jgi:lipid II:glycine glycyltransferase (peptidoglycan interpeptide bridge formation enzyme)